MNVNYVIQCGNLTRDPEIRTTSNGTVVCTFSLAVNRRYTGSDGQAKDDTTYVDVTAYGKTGELVAKYQRKGCNVLVQGRLQLDSWTDRATGQKRSRLSVVAESVQFGARQKPADEVKQEPKQEPKPATQPSLPRYTQAPEPAEDDIPF